MGEIAEAMLDGTFCAACGAYMDGGAEGFPRYCSAACEPDDYRRERERDRPKLEWFRVNREGELKRIARFVKAQSVNTYNGPKPDRKGDMIILLGWDDNPDSDWGRFKGNRAAIWFRSPDLAEKGEAEVRKALGWQPA